MAEESVRYYMYHVSCERLFTFTRYQWFELYTIEHTIIKHLKFILSDLLVLKWLRLPRTVFRVSNMLISFLWRTKRFITSSHESQGSRDHDIISDDLLSRTVFWQDRSGNLWAHALILPPNRVQYTYFQRQKRKEGFWVKSNYLRKMPKRKSAPRNLDRTSDLSMTYNNYSRTLFQLSYSGRSPKTEE